MTQKQLVLKRNKENSNIEILMEIKGKHGGKLGSTVLVTFLSPYLEEAKLVLTALSKRLEIPYV